MNKKVLKQGESAGFLYEGGIDYTLDEVTNRYEKLKEKDAIIGKAAFLWNEIASHQYFIYGNKRMGFTTADVFLDINGIKFNASTNDKHYVSKAISLGAFDEADVIGILTKSLK